MPEGALAGWVGLLTVSFGWEIQERLSACTMAFVEAHARREAAEDECDGRQADPTEEQIEQMQKKKKAPRPWSAANNLRPPAAFTGGEMI
jgi:hypothetical protein